MQMTDFSGVFSDIVLSCAEQKTNWAPVDPISAQGKWPGLSRVCNYSLQIELEWTHFLRRVWPELDGLAMVGMGPREKGCMEAKWSRGTW
ncbi:hypothetical protein SLA2020_523580 [Shorea laevis]